MAEELPLPPYKESLVILKQSITLGIIILKDQDKLSKGVTIRGSETNRTGFHNISFERSAINNINVDDLSSIYLSKDLLSKANGSLAGKELRLTSFLFGNSNLFLIQQAHKFHYKEDSSRAFVMRSINSKVMSVTVKSVELKDLNMDEELRMGFTVYEKPGKNRLVHCVFWDNPLQGQYSQLRNTHMKALSMKFNWSNSEPIY